MCDLINSEMFSENDEINAQVNSEKLTRKYIKAGFVRRGFAMAIDMILVVIAYLMFFNSVMIDIALGLGFTSTVFACLIFLFVLFIYFYFIVLEIFWGGKTLGKWIVGIEVINAGGALKSWEVMVRNLMRCTHFIPPLFIIPDLLSMIITRSDQTIGDIFAGTMVVRKNKYHK